MMPSGSQPSNLAMDVEIAAAAPLADALAADVGGASATAEAGPLSHIPLFSGLARQEQEALFQAMRVQSIAAHQTIFWRGDLGDSLYLINTGEVAVTVPNEQGEHITLDVLKAGGFFGEISLLDGGPRTASVRTTQPTELYVLKRDDLHSFLRQRPEVAIEILTIMGRRQRISTEALRGVKNPNVAFERTRVTPWQQVSDIIATVAASQWFILFHVLWFGVWILLNLASAWKLLPRNWAFDPFPFGLLTMVVSLEAIFLSIFVMVSQNRQAQKDRMRIDLDYQVNLKAQSEIMLLARKLDKIESRIAGGGQ